MIPLPGSLLDISPRLVIRSRIRFKGNFDGNGYRIYNLKISDTTQSYAGLFGSVHGAVIENLTVDGQVNADSKAAVLAGEANDSEIRNCISKGQVRGVGVIGGIVGEAYDSVFLECTNTAGVLGGTDASGTRKPLPEVSAVLRKAPLSVTVQTIPQTVTALCIPEGYVGGIAGNIYETEVYNSCRRKSGKYIRRLYPEVWWAECRADR